MGGVLLELLGETFSTSPMRLVPASVFTTRPAPTPLCLAWRTPTVIPRRGSTKEPTIPSDVFAVRVKLVFIVIGGGQVSKVDLVSQQAADTAEPLDELSAFL